MVGKKGKDVKRQTKRDIFRLRKSVEKCVVSFAIRKSVKSCTSFLASFFKFQRSLKASFIARAAKNTFLATPPSPPFNTNLNSHILESVISRFIRSKIKT